MKTEQDYIKDLAEIRSMMDRSTRFLSLSGLSGIMAGIYALVGAYLAYTFFYRETEAILNTSITGQEISGSVYNLILLAILILVLAIGTAGFLSSKKAKKNGEVFWNSAARRLVMHMAIPLVTGGILILILIFKGILGLIAPFTMIFYGLALINASKFTYDDVKYLGMTEIILGLISSYYSGLGLLFWAIGFGLMHIVYGVYMHLRYEK